METYDEAKESKMSNLFMEIEDYLLEDPIVKLNNVSRGQRKQSYRKSKLRWLGLFFQCFMLSGQKYCFDNPQALQSSFTSPIHLNLTNAQYSLFYSLYSSSNIIVPLFAGILIDFLSIRIALFLFSTIIIFGQGIFMWGGGQLNYTLMLFGRLIFGLGGECLAVTQTTSIARWFKNRELAFALSISLGCNRMGSLLNSSLTPYLFSKSGEYLLPLGVGLGICIFSWLCGCALNYMDKVSDEREGKIVEMDSDDEENPTESGLCGKLRGIFEFRMIYLLLVSILSLSYGSLLTFTGNANDLYSKAFCISNQMAGYYISLIYLTSAILLPFVGCFIDSFGKRTSVMIFSLISFLTTHCLVIYFDAQINKFLLIFPMVCCGIFYACFGGFIWNSIALVVRDEQLGMGYGVAYALINVNLVMTPLIYGYIHDSTMGKKFGYYWAEIYIIGQICCCVLVGIVTFAIDWKGDKKLWNRISKSEILESRKRSASKSFMSIV